MKLRYGLLFMIIVMSPWLIQGQDNGDYIADHYMPLVRTMDTFDEVISGKRTGYKLVVAYVYSLTDAELQPTTNAAGMRVYSEPYQRIDSTYKMIERFVAEKDDHFDAAGDRGVKFLGINLEHGDMQELRTQYKLPHSEMLLFFRDGKLVGQQPIQHGFKRADLQDFLQKAKFDDFLDDEIQRYEREEAREQRSRRRYRRYYSSYAGGPYLGFGYGYSPYYYRYPYSSYYGYYPFGYYHGYRRPYGGFNIGFGW